MALTKSFSYRGLTAPSAYHRISNISLFKDTDGIMKMRISVEIRAQPDALALELRTFIAPYDLAGTANAFIVGYKHLKSIPDYADAADV